MAPPTYSIIAGAALQFIDYDLDLSLSVDGKPLAQRRKPFHLAPEGGLVLLDKVKRPDGTEHFVAHKTGRDLTPHFEVETREAFECCLGRWLPLPFLAHCGTSSSNSHGKKTPDLDYGPTDWVRGFLSRLGGEEGKYRLTLVFDPQVEDREKSRQTTRDGAVIYPTLSREDVERNTTFALASDQKDYGWFVKLPWINQALRVNQDMFRQNNPSAKAAKWESSDFPESGYETVGKRRYVATEYLAVYSVFLEGLALSGGLGEVGLVNPKAAKPIEVDLVLDIGNSRLTGVLVETLPQRDTRLTDCYILPVRDLSEPAQVYMEPVSSQVEFAEPYFGQPELSLDSRPHARGGGSFPWPSTVRLGPEAARLAADSREDQGPTGMSSPKRYLWDTRQRDLEWYFNNKYERHGRGEEPANSRGAFLMKVNPAGIPLSALGGQDAGADGRRPAIPLPDEIKTGNDERMVAFESRYSRSSLMMFLLSEVAAQALSAVNNPMVRYGREYPDKPRRLARIILTVPTAMPLMEQNIFKTWARLAVETVWSALGWADILAAREAQADDFRRAPTVRCDWDEATCTQVVWLYNEIKERFHNNADELFRLLGRPRAVKPGAGGGEELASLRLASIDMGAGTTDLSITTYALHNPGQSSPLIRPHLEFREGFNVAGDDIMHKIIQTQFIGKIARAAADRQIRDAESLVGDLFRVTPQMGVQTDERGKKRLRSQFVTRVAVPLALEILKLYEGFDHRGDDRRESLTLRGVLEGEAAGRLESVLGYLEEPLRKAGWADFNLLDQVLEIDFREVDAEVNFVLEKVMTDLAEVIRLYDCDILILTGRPSRWPAMWLSPYRRLCLPVDRIVHMHKYRVGARYPFVAHGRIEDPKTTVVIGAIICALAEGSLEGITIDTSGFEPQPTTRHLGLLDAQGRLTRDRVWFGDIEVYAAEEVRREQTIQFNAPVPVGFRQLSCQRWTTTRLYSLEYKNAEFQKKAVGRLPYAVTLEYTLKEPEAEDESAFRRPRFLKRTEGLLKVQSITDKQGQNQPPGALTARLQTLRHDGGYWLDTGVLGDD